jgi:hypothetical protein
MTFRRIFLTLFVLVFHRQLIALLVWAATILFGLTGVASVKALAADGLRLAIYAAVIWAAAWGLRALARRVPRRSR